MPKQLKVFQAHLGFFDTVVAAPSQKAALAAFGSRQNLFHDGVASVASDPDAVKAALAQPGVVLKRMWGSHDPFVANPTLPKVEKLRPKVKHVQRPVAPKPEPPPEPDRSALDAAERALAGLKRQREESRASFDQRQKELAREKQQSERAFDDKQRVLERRLAEEKQAYKKLLRRSR